MKNPQVQEDLMKRVIQAESEVNALLLKIACEFTDGPAERLEYILGNLRQLVQFWREQLEKGEHLPFIHANT